MVSPYLDLAAVRHLPGSTSRSARRSGMRPWAGAQQPAFNFTDPPLRSADWYGIVAKVVRRALRGGRGT